MSTAEQPDQASSIPTSRKVLCVVYGAIAVAALIATWSQGGPYIHSVSDFLVTFWRDTRVNGASRFITADAIMLALSVIILMVIEARKHNVRFVWLYVVGSNFIAISVMFPLFLIARELGMGASDAPRLRTIDVVLLPLVGLFAVAQTIFVDVG